MNSAAALTRENLGGTERPVDCGITIVCDANLLCSRNRHIFIWTLNFFHKNIIVKKRNRHWTLIQTRFLSFLSSYFFTQHVSFLHRPRSPCFHSEFLLLCFSMAYANQTAQHVSATTSTAVAATDHPNRRQLLSECTSSSLQCRLLFSSSVDGRS